MGVIVKRPVHIKIIVTDQFKTQRSAEIRAAIAKLDAVGRRIIAQMDNGTGCAQISSAIGERLRVELRKNEQAKAALGREMGNILSLEVGAECHRGVMEGTVEVDIGDDISKLGVCEIVVRDDKIVEIRDGLCPEVNEILS